MEDFKFLTPAQLAKRWKVSIETLGNWRCSKPRKGPAYVKIGGIKYPHAEIIKYEKELAKK